MLIKSPNSKRLKSKAQQHSSELNAPLQHQQAELYFGTDSESEEEEKSESGGSIFEPS